MHWCGNGRNRGSVSGPFSTYWRFWNLYGLGEDLVKFALQIFHFDKTAALFSFAIPSLPFHFSFPDNPRALPRTHTFTALFEGSRNTIRATALSVYNIDPIQLCRIVSACTSDGCCSWDLLVRSVVICGQHHLVFVFLFAFSGVLHCSLPWKAGISVSFSTLRSCSIVYEIRPELLFVHLHHPPNTIVPVYLSVRFVDCWGYTVLGSFHSFCLNLCSRFSVHSPIFCCSFTSSPLGSHENPTQATTPCVYNSHSIKISPQFFYVNGWWIDSGEIYVS